MNSARPRRWFSRLFARKTDETSVSPYHAVAIHCTNNSCEAARNVQYERHVSAEAPLLPLAQCDRPDECECRYKHYDDRRGDARRGSGHGTPLKNDSALEDRRRGKGRREEDYAEDGDTFSVHEDSYYEHVGDTIRTALLNVDEADGVDPYNSGSFDKSKSWKPGSR